MSDLKMCAVGTCSHVATPVYRQVWQDGKPPRQMRLCADHDKLYWRLLDARLHPTVAMMANPPELPKESGMMYRQEDYEHWSINKGWKDSRPAYWTGDLTDPNI